jgi:thiamine-phosphate pyrophosphorylase
VTLPPLVAILDADAAAAAGWRPLDLARAFLDGGARLLQVRAKTASGAAFFDLARAVVAMAAPAGAHVIVNDRVDIAVAAGAAGVHVGQDDLSPTAVRRLAGRDALVGLSTHTQEQLASALAAPVDYVAIGPVFGTATKETGYAPIGLERVAAAARAAAACGLPLVAIGGITLERAGGVLGAGAAAVAVIGDLLAGGDPAGRVRAYMKMATA